MLRRRSYVNEDVAVSHFLYHALTNNLISFAMHGMQILSWIVTCDVSTYSLSQHIPQRLFSSRGNCAGSTNDTCQSVAGLSQKIGEYISHEPRNGQVNLCQKRIGSLDSGASLLVFSALSNVENSAKPLEVNRFEFCSREDVLRKSEIGARRIHVPTLTTPPVSDS